MVPTHVRKQISGYKIHKYNSTAVSFGTCGSEATKAIIQRNAPHMDKGLKSKKTMNPVLIIGAWNVRTMMQKGKLENVKLEMKRNNINILGLSKVRWKDIVDFKSEEKWKKSEAGVAILLDKKVQNNISDNNCVNERTMKIKIKADPVDLVVIEINMYTSSSTDEEVEEMYEKIEELTNEEK